MIPATDIEHRSAATQQPPPADRSGFPSGAEIGGRFDLPLDEGTCYLAESAEVAARERCGRFLAYRLPIPMSFIEDIVVSRVQVPEDAAPIADALASDASTHHQVTRELFGAAGPQAERPVDDTVTLASVLKSMHVKIQRGVIPSLVMAQVDDNAPVEDA